MYHYYFLLKYIFFTIIALVFGYCIPPLPLPFLFLPPPTPPYHIHHPTPLSSFFFSFPFNPTGAIRSPPTLGLHLQRFLPVKRKFFLATVTKCLLMGGIALNCWVQINLIYINYRMWSRHTLYVKCLETTLL